MGTTLFSRKLRGRTAGALFALVLGGSLVSLAQPPKPDTLYYKRIAIDTDASHAATDPELKKRLDSRFIISQPGPDEVDAKFRDGSGSGYDGSYWKIQPAAGKAVYTQVNKGSEGGLEITWAVPPEYLTAEEAFPYWITTVASKQGNYITGGAQYFVAPAERFEPGDEKTVVGNDPFSRIGAGTFSTGWTPKGEGRIMHRPKKNAGAFLIGVNLSPAGEGGISAHYHYEPLPPGQVPPKHPPEPPTKCEHTFAKEWNSDWGKLVIRLDGSKAAGTYANREGAFGPGTLSGTVTGDVLEGTWKDTKGDGTLRLVLSDDGCSAAGTHTVNPPGSSNTPQGPTGTDPGAGSPTGPVTPPSGDPGSDTVGQSCIDQWIKLAMSILNRRDKSNPVPNGPWRVSEYGQLVGHGVSSAGPPDGWDTTYHRNRYAYVWANWQQAHTSPDYGGELPALKDYVASCREKNGGSGTPSKPGTTGYPPGTDPATPMTLLAENRTVLAGATVLVPVWLVNGADVANLNFTVGYNGTVAKPEGDPGKGNLLGEALFSANPKEAGLIRLGFAQSKGLSGTGTVAYLPFKAVGKPGDRTALHLEVQIINNPGGTALTVARIDGSITIVGPDGLVPGDCDGDGVLTTIDAKCALDMSVKLIVEKLNMDMDGDGQVTSRDATIILQRRAYFLAGGGQ